MSGGAGREPGPTTGAAAARPPGGDPPAVGDLNGDGKPDIAVTAGSDGIAILYAK